MNQLSLSFIRPDLEEARQKIQRTEEVVEEQPAGRLRSDNENRLDRAKGVLFTAECASFEGYEVQSEIELINYLIKEILTNLR